MVFRLGCVAQRIAGTVIVPHYVWAEKDPPIPAAAPPKRRAPLLCRYRELAVELGDVMIPQKLIGALQGRDSRHSQFLGNRFCQFPKFRSDRPRASGEYAAIVWAPSSCMALPTCVDRLLSTLPPAVGV